MPTLVPTMVHRLKKSLYKCIMIENRTSTALVLSQYSQFNLRYFWGVGDFCYR
jgi:hypothetical protein